MFHHTISLDKTNVFAICYVIILRSVIYGVKDYYTLYVTFVNKINAIFYYSGVMGFAENLRTELDMDACAEIVDEWDALVV